MLNDYYSVTSFIISTTIWPGFSSAAVLFYFWLLHMFIAVNCYNLWPWLPWLLLL